MNLEEIRKTWIKEEPAHAAFGKLVEHRIREAVKKKGIWCDTSSRTKETHSLVKKLMKGKHTYDTLPDKVGVRCIVKFLSELDEVIQIVQGLFDCSQPDWKIRGLEEDRVGYAGVHVEVRLKPRDPDFSKHPAQHHWAELQIRTLGQHFWSEISHDSFYKNEETFVVLPIGLKRRVNLLAGLTEVADREFDRIDKELPLVPEAEIYKTLERHYYKLTTKRPDPELSLEIISLLSPLYAMPSTEIKESIDTFFAGRYGVLVAVYAGAEELTASALLYQPEAVMVYQLLEKDQIATRTAWNTKFPESELERVANMFGISFD